MNTINQLKETVKSNGINLFGIADVSQIKSEFLLPADTIKPLNYAVSIGFRLSGSVLNTITDGPNHLYFFHYQRINVLLDTVALKLTSILQENSFLALPIPSSQLVDWNNMKAHVCHRKIGYLAGHGWFGRNNLLINPQYGAQIRYVTVLTDFKPEQAGTPMAEQNCGTCKRCISVCPANAITESGFDLEKCKLQLKAFQKTHHMSQMICGLCLKCCPGKNE